MLDPEIRREIKREIKAQASVIMNCLMGACSGENQDIDEPFPEAPTIKDRPVAHPYGFYSRCPKGKLAVSARVGEHPAARIIVGVRDKNRDGMDFLADGEVCLYAEDGSKIVLRKDKVQLGSENAANPAVLGNELKALLEAILDALIAGNTALSTSPGSPTAPNPPIAAQLTQLKQTYCTTATTNILSQKVMTERGA